MGRWDEMWEPWACPGGSTPGLSLGPPDFLVEPSASLNRRFNNSVNTYLTFRHNYHFQCISTLSVDLDLWSSIISFWASLLVINSFRLYVSISPTLHIFPSFLKDEFSLKNSGLTEVFPSAWVIHSLQALSFSLEIGSLCFLHYV